MRTRDLLELILGNLARRKARVALTAIGVVIGSAAILVLVSLAIGLQRNASESLFGIGELTKINVSPGYGDTRNDEGDYGGGVFGFDDPSGGTTLPKTPITQVSLEEFAALPGVQSVIPVESLTSSATVTYRTLESYASIIGIGTDDLSQIGVSATQGELELSKGTVILGFGIPRDFFDPNLRPGQKWPPPPELLGETITLVLQKFTKDGEEQKKELRLRVVGILAESQTEADWSIYLPLSEVSSLNEWNTGKRINRNREGYTSAIVQVEDAKLTLEIAKQIKEQGYQAFTAQSFVQGLNSFFIVLQIMFGGVGAISLFVAAIGIANTMTMAILERTREIGLMKAVGATNQDVMGVFLGEAAGIGLLGGLGGIILGWIGGQLINIAAQTIMAGQQPASQGAAASTPLNVSTPIGLLIFVLAFAIVIGLISGVYPALRAATLVPVEALRNE